MFFEICHALKTAMGRITTLRNLRAIEPIFPDDFPQRLPLQTKLIQSLLRHRSEQRPSSLQILQSDLIPVKIEDETIQMALKALTDPAATYYRHVLNSLFTKRTDVLADRAYDFMTVSHIVEMIADFQNPVDLQEITLQSSMKSEVLNIFRRHGAIEVLRPLLSPCLPEYGNQSTVRLLDRRGSLVQLPFDLTLPYARMLGRTKDFPKSFTFGSVYRETGEGGHPRMIAEVDFDLTSRIPDQNRLNEAECFKTLDEILQLFLPKLLDQIYFVVNHHSLFTMIMDYCDIHHSERGVVWTILSQLGHEITWTQLVTHLKTKTSITSTSLNDLRRFDISSDLQAAKKELCGIFNEAGLVSKTEEIFVELFELEKLIRNFGVQRKMVMSCLATHHKENFYRSAVTFQLVMRSSKRLNVLAAGGRYDSLVYDHRVLIDKAHLSSVVGFNLAWEKLVRIVNKRLPNGLSRVNRGELHNNPIWRPYKVIAFMKIWN